MSAAVAGGGPDCFRAARQALSSCAAGQDGQKINDACFGSIDRDEQETEPEWFIEAAEPFRGMNINMVSETITTHAWQARVLARAYFSPPSTA